MRISIQSHEWELEGDLSMSVWLDLVFTVTVHALGIDTAEVCCVTVTGVTFVMQRQELICDGAGGNPLLPIELRSWLASRFLSEWTDNESLRQSFRDLLEQRAIDQHFEQLAAR